MDVELPVECHPREKMIAAHLTLSGSCLVDLVDGIWPQDEVWPD